MRNSETKHFVVSGDVSLETCPSCWRIKSVRAKCEGKSKKKKKEKKEKRRKETREFLFFSCGLCGVKSSLICTFDSATNFLLFWYSVDDNRIWDLGLRLQQTFDKRLAAEEPLLCSANLVVVNLVSQTGNLRNPTLELFVLLFCCKLFVKVNCRPTIWVGLHGGINLCADLTSPDSITGDLREVRRNLREPPRRLMTTNS